ncbi:MAG TPA: hypothetical protein VG943_13470 [Caulobacterales bacterium]|nr:hypothetical protein [Caulobacterales bacterium]
MLRTSLVCLALLALAACGPGARSEGPMGSAGSASGPNPNMVALNAHYDPQWATGPDADYVPAFLYYLDAPKPGAPAPTAQPAPTPANVMAEAPAPPRT